VAVGGEDATPDSVEHNGSRPYAAGAVVLSTRDLWIPLVVVIAVLATLVIAPVAVSARVRSQRANLTDYVDPARLRATDVTSFLAEQMFAIGMRTSPGLPSADPRYVAALGSEHRGALALDSLLRFSNADELERFAEYREASTRWHDDVESMTQSPNAAVLDTARMDGDTAVIAARHLVETLEQSGNSARADVRRWERVDLLLPLFLGPLALLACVLIVRAGQRTVRLAAAAERDRRALAAAMDQKSAFMRGISHDLQNPLGAALGNVDLILEGVTKAGEEHDALLRVRRLTKRASDTVASLLAVAQSDTGDIGLHTTPIDLRALSRAAVDDHSFMAGAKDQTVEMGATTELRAMGDAPRVRHIIDNLLSNASKYTPRGGRIRVDVTTRMRNERRWACVTVRDSGPGIPPDWRERVFDEYARVPASRDLAPGFGIGLAVSRRIARIMGGDVTVDETAPSTNGREQFGGATVSLWLRLAEER
jgi:signal transduction histidine kinase